MSDTQRTDEAIAKSNGQWSYELRDLCCQLERDLAEAKKQRDKLADALRDLMFDCLRFEIKSSDDSYKAAEQALAAVKEDSP